MSDEQYYLIDIRRNSAVEWKYKTCFGFNRSDFFRRV